MNEIMIYSIAVYFADMVNPENVTPKFDWNRFPELAVEYGKEQLYLSNTENNIIEEKKYLEFARQLVERAGLNNT